MLTEATDLLRCSTRCNRQLVDQRWPGRCEKASHCATHRPGCGVELGRDDGAGAGTEHLTLPERECGLWPTIQKLPARSAGCPELFGTDELRQVNKRFS